MLQLPLEEAPFHTTELSVEAGVGLLNQITRYLTDDSILNFYSHLESFFELGNDLSMFDLEQDLTLETESVSFNFPIELDSFNDLTFSLDITTMIESAERLWQLVSSEYFSDCQIEESRAIKLTSHSYQQFFHVHSLLSEPEWYSEYFSKKPQLVNFLQTTYHMLRTLESDSVASSREYLSDDTFNFDVLVFEPKKLESSLARRFKLSRVRDVLVYSRQMVQLAYRLAIMSKIHPLVSQEMIDLYEAKQQSLMQEKETSAAEFIQIMESNVISINDLTHKTGTKQAQKDKVDTFVAPFKDKTNALPYNTPVFVYENEVHDWYIELPIDVTLTGESNTTNGNYCGVFYYAGYSEQDKSHKIMSEPDDATLFSVSFDIERANHVMQTHQGFSQSYKDTLAYSIQLEEQYPLLFQQLTPNKKEIERKEIDLPKEFYVQRKGSTNTVHRVTSQTSVFSTNTLYKIHSDIHVNNSMSLFSEESAISSKKLVKHYTILTDGQLMELFSAKLITESSRVQLLGYLANKNSLNHEWVHRELILNYLPSTFEGGSVRLYVFGNMIALTQGSDLIRMATRTGNVKASGKKLILDAIQNTDNQNLIEHDFGRTMTLYPILNLSGGREDSLLFDGEEFIN